MAITTSTPFNKQYAVLTGTFTGSQVTQFWIKINNQSGTEFKWKIKEGTSAWSSENTVTDHSAQTAKLLTLGMSVTFTRPSLGSYATGDRWIFEVSPDYKISPAVTGETTNFFDRLIPIDKEDKQHLIALNSSSGEVAYLQDYNTNLPIITQASSIPPSTSTNYDFVVNNKLAYVGTGKSSSSQVVGFVKNNDFGISNAEEFETIQEKSYQNVAVTSTSHKVMTDFVTLDGGTGDEAPNLVVGFDVLEEEAKLYVYNRGLNKVTTKMLPSTPTSVRLAYNKHSSGVVNGVGVLMAGIGENIAMLQILQISDDGSAITVTNTYNIEKPLGNTELTKYSDFLIVPRINDITSNSNVFDLVLGAGDINSQAELNDGFLFKVEDLNSFTGDGGGQIESSDQLQMSPKVSYTNAGSVSAHMWIRRESDDGSFQDIPYKANVQVIQRICLMFLGYDSTGANPQIGVTVKIQVPYYSEDTEQGPYGGYSESTMYPLWWDGSKEWVLSWITYVLPINAVGRNAVQMLGHFKIGGDLTKTYNNEALSVNNLPACSPQPLFQRVGTKNGYNKCFVYGDSTNGQRVGMYYLSKPGSTTKITTIPINTLQFNGHLEPFPCNNNSTYTTFSAYSSAYSSSSPTSIQTVDLPTTTSESYLTDRYVLGDREHQVALSATLPATTVKVLVTKRDDELDEIYLSGLTANLGSNLISSSAPWFNLGTVTANGAKEWLGGDSMKKVFYKCSFLYDGFQESALINEVEAFDNSGSTFTEGLQIPIEIDESAVYGDLKKISRRITAVILYRADDGRDGALEPDGLYRFVKEIPIDQFYLDGTTYKFTVQDDGSKGASYEAINGIPETLGSLGMDYAVNASINGYMFVGNCTHQEYPDAENIIFRSEPNKYSIFNWSTNFIQLDFIPTAMEGFLGKLYVFGKNQMCIVNPETLVIEDKINGIGCIGPKSLKVSPSGLYWVDYNNIYSSTPKIDKIGTTIINHESYGWEGLTNAEKNEAVVAYDSHRQTALVFFVKGADKRCWAYYIPQKRWDLWETDYKVFDAVSGDDGYPVLLCEEGRLIKMGAGTERRNWQWRSKKLTLGSDTNYKKMRVAKIDATSRNLTDLSYQTDNDSDYVTGTDVSNNYGTSWLGNAVRIASSQSKARWIRLKATGTNGATSNVRAFALGLIYKPKKPK